MSVMRQDKTRVIAFKKFEDAQLALGQGPFHHVMAELISQKVETISGGEMIVWETTEQQIATDMHDIHVDICAFVPPHFLEVQETLFAQSAVSGDEYLENLFLM